MKEMQALLFAVAAFALAGSVAASNHQEIVATAQAGAQGPVIVPQAATPGQDSRLTVLDANFYLNKYPDLKNAFGNSVPAAHKHWLDVGIREGRDSSPNFSIGGYLARYPELQKVFGNDYTAALNHWLQYGEKEKRDPRAAGTWMADPRAAALDPIFYANKYPDLKQAFGYNVPQLINHWLQYGIKEGHLPNAQAQPASPRPAPGSYGRGAGFAVWDEARCNKENPQGCEKDGLVFYPKCSAGYKGIGPACWKK